MKESKIDNISEIMSQHDIPEAAEPIRDIQEIEQDHLLRLLEASNIEQFLEESNSVGSDRDFMLKAVKLNGLALEAASEELKNDRDLVLQAIEHSDYGYALEYASPSLRADKEVVEIAALNGVDSLRFADKELLLDESYTRLLLEIDGNALRYAPEEFKENDELILLAVSSNPQAFQYAGPHIRNEILEKLKSTESLEQQEIIDNPDKKFGILEINPVVEIRRLWETTPLVIKDKYGKEEINSTLIAELGYWVRQFATRMKNKPGSNFVVTDQKPTAMEFIFNIKYFSVDVLNIVGIDNFKNDVLELAQKVEANMEYDDDWLKRPELWTIPRRMNIKEDESRTL